MAAKRPKNSRKLERHFKGVANHRRIDILLLAARRPGIILEEIIEQFDGNQKTFSEHTRRLVIAGLIEKTYDGRMVRHKLTPYGEIFVSFIRKFANLGDAEA